MNRYQKILLFTGILLSGGAMHAAVGDVTPLSRADLGKVDAMMVKAFKGKPTVQGGTKEELDGGWRIKCRAEIGSGGVYDVVLMAEKSLTLGYVESQKPATEPAKDSGPAAGKAAPKKT